MGTLALIGLGSNLGDRRAHLDGALAALAETPGLSVHSVSRYHETAPAGGPPGQGAFLNAAARLDSDLDPQALLRQLQQVEAQAGRVRSVRWGERPIDLDLLIYGCKRIRSPELTLPHPRMAVRRFVLAPLAEVAPEIVDTNNRHSIAELLANLDRRPSYVAIRGPAGTFRDEVFRTIVEGLPSIGLPESEIRSCEAADDPVDIPLGIDLPTKLRSKVRLLERRYWDRSLGEARWLVTDFCLTASSIYFEDFTPLHSNRTRMEIKNRYDQALRDWLLPPTFILELSGGPLNVTAGRVDHPSSGVEVLLIPESDTAEEIAREVLAACKASRCD